MNITKKLLGLNYAPGRSGGGLVDMIVLHATEGDRASVIDWFNNPAANVSAHYMVQKDGVIVQFVEERDTAWHAGRVDHPTAPLVLARPGVNPNSYSIGIEHESNGREALTDAQRAASVALVADIAMRYGIPIDSKHIVGHHTIYALKTCPGSIDVADVIRRAAPVPKPVPKVRPPAPVLVWSDYFGDWLVVTASGSDRDWKFVTMKDIRGGMLAQIGETPLSQMPR